MHSPQTHPWRGDTQKETNTHTHTHTHTHTRGDTQKETKTHTHTHTQKLLFIKLTITHTHTHTHTQPLFTKLTIPEQSTLKTANTHGFTGQAAGEIPETS